VYADIIHKLETETRIKKNAESDKKKTLVQHSKKEADKSFVGFEDLQHYMHGAHMKLSLFSYVGGRF
jgi:hypothetical protein